MLASSFPVAFMNLKLLLHNVSWDIDVVVSTEKSSIGDLMLHENANQVSKVIASLAYVT